MVTNAPKQWRRALIAVVAIVAIPTVAKGAEPPQKQVQTSRPDYYAPAQKAALQPLKLTQRPTGNTVNFRYSDDEKTATENDAARLPSPIGQKTRGADESNAPAFKAAGQQPVKKATNKVRSSAATKPDRLLNTLKPLGTISLDISGDNEDTPNDIYSEHHPGQAVPFEMIRSEYRVAQFEYHWAASNLSHYPLYTEDVALERYGKGYCPALQPVVSGLKFYHSVATLPYRMGVNLPGENMYVLGYHRPGNWSPSVRESLPWSWRGAAFQAGVAAGGVYLFPVP